jgi:hypothetical protein
MNDNERKSLKFGSFMLGCFLIALVVACADCSKQGSLATERTRAIKAEYEGKAQIEVIKAGQSCVEAGGALIDGNCVFSKKVQDQPSRPTEPSSPISTGPNGQIKAGP